MQEEMQCKIINRVNHSGGSGSLMPLKMIHNNSKYMPLALGTKYHEAATLALSANGLSFLCFWMFLARSQVLLAIHHAFVKEDQHQVRHCWKCCTCRLKIDQDLVP